MKGVMLTICPGLQIVDISHEILPGDIRSAAFVLGQAYTYFPENTLHIVVVDPSVGSGRPILYVEGGSYRFLVPDNGVLQYIFREEKVLRIFQINNREYFLPQPSHTFHGRDIFAPVAAHLANGVKPEQLGVVVKAYQQIIPPQPVVTDAIIRGEIIYIDRFGNLISNITRELMQDVLHKHMPVRILVADQEIKEISESFCAKPFGHLLAYIDSSDYLAVAINGQNAAQKMGISIGGTIELQLI